MAINVSEVAIIKNMSVPLAEISKLATQRSSEPVMQSIYILLSKHMFGVCLEIDRKTSDSSLFEYLAETAASILSSANDTI